MKLRAAWITVSETGQGVVFQMHPKSVSLPAIFCMFFAM
jgi:hypothetical protein